MSRGLTIGFVQISRVILWLAGFFALLGLLWRPPIEISPFSGCLITLTLAAWVEILISFSSIFTKPNHFTGHHELLVPAFFLGFLLPLPLPILYIALLGTGEIVRYFWKRASPQRNSSLSKILIPLADQIHLDENFSDEENDDSITQQIVRRQTEEGTDRLEGNYLIEFRNDQSTATIHIPFVPAFESVPKINIFCLDNVEVKWNIFEPRNFGVRVDIKKTAHETSRIRIMVIAECSK